MMESASESRSRRGRAIALGTLVGAALYQAVTEAFGWWQLQIGRALRRKG